MHVPQGLCTTRAKPGPDRHKHRSTFSITTCQVTKQERNYLAK